MIVKFSESSNLPTATEISNTTSSHLLKKRERVIFKYHKHLVKLPLISIKKSDFISEKELENKEGDKVMDNSNPFYNLSINDILALCELLKISTGENAAVKVSKNKKSLIKEFHILEILYNILKNIIKSKSLSEREKKRINNELEVILLRLKGKNRIIAKNPDYDEGLKFFQKAVEVCSISQQEISKTDLNLIKKIFEQQKKKITLQYLNEISGHTLILVDKIFKSSPFLMERFSGLLNEEIKYVEGLFNQYLHK